MWSPRIDKNPLETNSTVLNLVRDKDIWPLVLSLMFGKWSSHGVFFGVHNSVGKSEILLLKPTPQILGITTNLTRDHQSIFSAIFIN